MERSADLPFLSPNEFDIAALQMTKELFMAKGDKHGLDLLAIDIYRGREHGLPGYVVYVKFCLNKVINDWHDLVTHGLMTQEVIRQSLS
jgi:peroxidase